MRYTPDESMNLMRKRIIFGLCGVFVVLSGIAIYMILEVHATAAEKALRLSGDDLIPQPIGSVNHAITIRRPPRDIWPWLVQMGAGRGGWYAYDFIDNGGHPSAERVLPEYQKIAVGEILPAVPNATDVFVVTRYEPERSLVLAWRLPAGTYQTTWAFVLEPSGEGRTRLIVRGRVAAGYRPYGLPQWIALSLGRTAHFIMERKQMLGIARRAELLP